MRKLLLIIFLAATSQAQTHKLCRFLVDPITQQIVIADNCGIIPVSRDHGSFRLYFSPTKENSQNYQVHVTCIGEDVCYHVGSPGSDSFDIFINKLSVVDGTVTATPYDPDQLCTVSIDWVDE